MSVSEISEKYNGLVIRERILVLLLMLSLVFFVWYVFWGLSVESAVQTAKTKREALLSLSESIISKYDVQAEKQSFNRNIAIIGKRMSSVKSKMGVIDSDLKRFNQETIAIGEIVLLLRDILSANQSLSLESLKVYPAELIRKKDTKNGDFTGVFEKNVIALTLKGNYASVFDYLKKIEALTWSVFWQDVQYKVDQYPAAVVTIQLYTLSIIEDERYAAK
jgi:MSHA biogenesis protein MshJ